MEYIGFEETIPEREYGAGTVMVRDTGTFVPLVWGEHRIEVVIHNRVLSGKYNLIRFNKGGENAWLIVKSRAV